MAAFPRRAVAPYDRELPASPSSAAEQEREGEREGKKKEAQRVSRSFACVKVRVYERV